MLNEVADGVWVSTHPHWDHLLWHPRFGDVPRYAMPAAAEAASSARERGQQMAAESASGIPLELLGLVSPLPADGGPVPGEVIEHQAHAAGHAAVLLADRGVLLAGDMLSDVLVPGHGAIARGPEVAARLAADHAYIDALRHGGEPLDPRQGPDTAHGRHWLPIHQANLEQARAR